MTSTAVNSDELKQQLDEAKVKIENLEVALGTCRTIGMAVGIVMDRFKLSDEQAFDALRTVSQRTHRKLRDLAADLVYSGVLPS